MNGETNNIAKNIKTLRHSMGMTLSDLEEKTGIGHKIINKYETGRCNPTVDKVFLIADALNVKVGILITGDITLKVDIK